MSFRCWTRVSCLVGLLVPGLLPGGERRFLELEDDHPGRVASGLIDRDAIPDLVFVDTVLDRAFIYLGTGLDFVWSGDFECVADAAGVSIADMDSDGAPDVVVTSLSVAALTIGFGDGEGHVVFFYDEGLESRDASARGVIAQFENDSPRSLLLSATTSDDVVIYTPYSQRSPLRVPATVHFPDVVATGDLNGDSREDWMVWGKGSEDVVAIFEGDGTGGFVRAAGISNFPSPVGLPALAAPADVDGDGATDVILLSRAPLAEAYVFLYWLRGRTYEVRRIGPPLRLRNPASISTGDIDGDAGLDLIVTSTDEDDEKIVVFHRISGGEPQWGPPCVLETPGLASSTVADFDGDTRSDVAFALPSAMRVEIVAAVSGECVPARRCAVLEQVHEGAETKSVVISDVDGDGTEEVLVVEGASVQVLSSTLAGIDVRAVLALDEEPAVIRSADMDRDGLADVLAAGRGSGDLRLYLLDAAFNVSARRSVMMGAGGILVVEDLNRDGRADMASSSMSGDALTVLLQTASGDFQAIQRLAGLPLLVAAVKGRFNGDDLPDLALASRDGSILLLFNGGDARFEEQSVVPLSLSIESVSSGNLNQDGIDDLVVSTSRTDALGLVLSQDAAFSVKYRSLPPGSGPSSHVLIDMDGDGRDEIVLGNLEARSVSVLEIGAGDVLEEVDAMPVEGVVVGPLDSLDVVAAHLDRNGALDIAAFAAGAGIWLYLSDGCGKDATFRRGDVTADGRINLTDPLNLLLSLFGGGTGPACPDAADADDDGVLKLTDAIRILRHLYLGEERPPDPGPADCGRDPTDDDLPSCRQACF